MSGVLGVLTGPEAEVESKLDQVGDITGFGSASVAAVDFMEWTMPRGTDFYPLTGGSSML